MMPSRLDLLTLHKHITAKSSRGAAREDLDFRTFGHSRARRGGARTVFEVACKTDSETCPAKAAPEKRCQKRERSPARGASFFDADIAAALVCGFQLFAGFTPGCLGKKRRELL